MPLTKLAADTFGVVTVSLVCLLAIVGLLCVYQSIYFWLRIRRGDFLQLSYFNGPWTTRIVLILIAILWGVGEIAKLGLLKGKDRLFTGLIWQQNICKFYILSNLGFLEPSMFLVIVFLLRASLQKTGSSTLSQRWNRRTVWYVLLFCLPILTMQVAFIYSGPKWNEENRAGRTKISPYFTSTSSVIRGNCICTYPLFSTILLGLFDALLACYVVYIGTRMLFLVINKGLRRRVYWLMASLIFFLPVRAVLLGFSVLPRVDDLAHESIVFVAFVMQLCSAMVAIYMLVYCPVADSLELRDVRHIEMEGMPYDDFYSESASLAANRSQMDMARSSNGSMKQLSVCYEP